MDDVDHRGKQYRASAVAGHVRGKMDGKVLGLPEAPKTWHVVECKSMKDTYWEKVKKHGVREGYFAHWVQLNTYCHLFGFERGFYICRNKNTGEVYSERIHTDHVEATPWPVSRYGHRSSICRRVASWAASIAPWHRGAPRARAAP